jgi:hypothetical protein
MMSKIFLLFLIHQINSQFSLSLHKKNLLKPFHRQRLLSDTSTPIFGNTSSLNYYYVNINVGTPSKTQSLIIDTGSFITTLPCQPYCQECGTHLNSYYNITASSTSEEITCSYSECSTLTNSRCQNHKCIFSSVYIFITFRHTEKVLH